MEKDLKEYLKELDLFLNSDIIKNLSNKDMGYSDNRKANDLIFTNDFAFIIGLIFDQGIKSNLAWQAPYLLKQRLGILTPQHISNMTVNEMEEVIKANNYTLHRYPSTIAKNLIKSSIIINQEFKGDTKNIWFNNSSYKGVKKNLLKLAGIGEKKANLAILMLSRDFNHKYKDINTLPLALDVHLKRVLKRSGFFLNNEDRESTLYIEEIFREAFPKFHALTGTPLWYIGQNFCHAKIPNCRPCPLFKKCKRKNIKSKDNELGLF